MTTAYNYIKIYIRNIIINNHEVTITRTLTYNIVKQYVFQYYRYILYGMKCILNTPVLTPTTLTICLQTAASIYHTVFKLQTPTYVVLMRIKIVEFSLETLDVHTLNSLSKK